MYTLVILIETPDDWAAFDEAWPQFLHHAEGMPGLRLEAHSRVETVLYGSSTLAIMHELFFDSAEAARQAMTSPEGREAGRVLQAITKGHMTLVFADQKQDDLENIRKYQDSGSSGKPFSA
jgi:uncharacterized protein (TIGR02118 family)